MSPHPNNPPEPARPNAKPKPPSTPSSCGRNGKHEETRATLRRDSYHFWYHRQTTEKQLEEDKRRAQLEADYNNRPLPLAPFPKWGITPQPF